MLLDELIKLSNTTYGRCFDETVAKYPKREAFVFQDNRVTWEQAQQRINSLAKGLLKIGVRKGDKVGVWMTNNLEWIYSFVAISKIGAVIGAINTRFKTVELTYSLLQSDISTLIFKDVFLGKINALDMVDELLPELSHCKPGGLRSKKLPLLRNVICVGSSRRKGMYSFDEVMGLGNDYALDDELAKVAASVNPEDVVNHIYTSGTTGLPKAVMNTHTGWIRQAYWEASEECLGIRENDRMLGPFPFAGGMGISSILFSIVHGVSLFPMESWDAEDALRLIERERLTCAYQLGASMARMMLDHPNFGKYDISSFKRVQMAGEPVAKELIQEMYDRMEIETVMNQYGMVEAHGAFTQVNPTDTREQATTTVGNLRPWATLRITDPNTGKEMPVGQDGEIWVRGTRPDIEISKGYYKLPDKTAEFIDKNGWVHTGDMGHIRQEDGYLVLTGRLKDMIIVGAYNVYPAEIEVLLATHPKVARASVVGVPDRRLGEVPMAFIELKAAEAASEIEILDFCKDKLANTKVPKYIKFVAQIPTTMQGKVEKFKLRDMAIQEMGVNI